jgi:hypothetical protein
MECSCRNIPTYRIVCTFLYVIYNWNRSCPVRINRSCARAMARTLDLIGRLQAHLPDNRQIARVVVEKILLWLGLDPDEWRSVFAVGAFKILQRFVFVAGVGDCIRDD